MLDLHFQRKVRQEEQSKGKDCTATNVDPVPFAKSTSEPRAQPSLPAKTYMQHPQ